MLGILMLFFIGRYYYQLAFEFEKNKWVFAIIGILTYYAGTLIAAFIFGAVAVLSGNESWLEMGDLGLSLIALPFGLLAAWGLYRILDNNWKNKKKASTDSLIDEL